MTKALDRYQRVVKEDWLDGFIIVGDEGWLPEEYYEEAYQCPECMWRFMLWPDHKDGRRPTYCSDICRRNSNTRRTQQWRARKAAEARA